MEHEATNDLRAAPPMAADAFRLLWD